MKKEIGNAIVTISRKERDRLIGKISRSSGVAKYAIEKKMNDEDILIASQHLNILNLIKSSNNYNRYIQGRKTAEANARIKEFTDLQNSEILKAGQWIVSALSLNGKERKAKLNEGGLVHKDDHNEVVIEMKSGVMELKSSAEENATLAEEIILKLENRIDTLAKQQMKTKEFILTHYGLESWKEIQDEFEGKADNQSEITDTFEQG